MQAGNKWKLTWLPHWPACTQVNPLLAPVRMHADGSFARGSSVWEAYLDVHNLTHGCLSLGVPGS